MGICHVVRHHRFLGCCVWAYLTFELLLAQVVDGIPVPEGVTLVGCLVATFLACVNRSVIVHFLFIMCPPPVTNEMASFKSSISTILTSKLFRLLIYFIFFVGSMKISHVDA